MAVKVLVIEDDPNTLNIIEIYAQDEPFEIIMAQDGIQGLERLKSNAIDIVVTDVRLPGIGGEELVSYIHSLYATIPIIVMTGYATVEGAVTFLRQGAFDYITKPFTRQVFIHRLHLAAQHQQLTQEVDKLRASQGRTAVDLIIGNSSSMMKIMSILPTIAQTDAAVLILGESGTGKEMLARAIHSVSRRAACAFVPINCGALPEQLLESELFGYKRGAFTDARQDRAGLVEEADKGTLFLDEIAEMSPTVQVKLLRFLQEKEFRPLGSSTIKQADVRILSATNQDLERRVKTGQFREDLYYRLNVIPMVLPPLRERTSDIPLLANHYLRHFATEYERAVNGFTPEVMQRFLDHRWPGNIRELINSIQRFVLLAPGDLVDNATLERASFARASPQETSEPAQDLGYKQRKEQIVAQFEREYLQRCLLRAEGNISEAARVAQIDRKNFWQLMRKHGIDANVQAKDNDGET